LGYLKSFNKHHNDALPNHKPIGNLLRDFVDVTILRDDSKYDRLLTVMAGKNKFLFLHAVAWVRHDFLDNK
jgi:hypothetical protein